MFRLCISFLCVTALLVGCSGSSKPKVQLRTVKGTVKLDGKPMASGDVLFLVQNQGPKTLSVKDGNFSGEVIEGQSRVEIRSYKDAAPVMMMDQVANPGAKENFIPAKFNSESTLTADVTASGPNEFNFEVTSN